jgi:hypothetical protein
MQILPFKCLVNGGIDADHRRAVSGAIIDCFARHVPQVRLAEIEFVEVAPGLWFTAGKPSHASMLLGCVPKGTAQDIRIALMDDLAHRFSEITGAPYHDVMVVAADTRE